MTNEIKLLIFDLDDTLIDTSDHFYQCRSKFAYLISENSVLSTSAVVETLEKLDDLNFKRFGYIPWRYELSMLQTYIHFVEDKKIGYRSDLIAKITEIGRFIYTAYPRIQIGAAEILKQLSVKYDIALLTRGEENAQRAKVDHYEWNHYFRRIEVVEKKSVDAYKNLLSHFSLDPNQCCSIGDSPRWDIQPAVELGMKAIQIAHQHPEFDWTHDMHDQRVDNVPILTKLMDLMDIFNKL